MSDEIILVLEAAAARRDERRANEDGRKKAR